MHDEEKESLLHRTDRGFVRFCVCCERFQIGFGNALLVLHRSEFNELHQSLAGVDPYKVPEERMPNGKTHLIKSSCQSFMALDGEEITEFQELLDGAAAGLQVEELLRER